MQILLDDQNRQISTRPAFGSRLITRTKAQCYHVRLAKSLEDVRAAQALRFAVFNLELHEGLSESYTTGLDADEFDEICDHLLVEELKTGEIVGTYRLQTGRRAAENRGYYSAREFDFTPFEQARGQIVELGRACVHRRHRNLVVLGLLWKGIANYARENKCRYLLGCSSLPVTDPSAGIQVYEELREAHLASGEWRTLPLGALSCEAGTAGGETVKIPKLMAAYFSLGAKICGPPAIDREFKTIDFLTLLDLQALPDHVAERYFDGGIKNHAERAQSEH